jgi:hypothetical protein
MGSSGTGGACGNETGAKASVRVGRRRFADLCPGQNERVHVAHAAAVNPGRVGAETGRNPEVV